MLLGALHQGADEGLGRHAAMHVRALGGVGVAPRELGVELGAVGPPVRRPGLLGAGEEPAGLGAEGGKARDAFAADVGLARVAGVVELDPGRALERFGGNRRKAAPRRILS